MTDTSRGFPGNDRQLEADIHHAGSELLLAMRAHANTPLDSRFWSDKLMQWSTQDTAFKTQLFQLVDVYPVLRGRDDVARHVQEYLHQPGVQMPSGMGTALAAGRVFPGAMAKVVGKQIEQMARTFIAGRDVNDAADVLRERWQQHIAFSLDLLGEACLSDEEAAAYQQRYVQVIGQIADEAATWPACDQLERDHLGVVPRVNVSIKVSSLVARFSPVCAQASIEQALAALEPVLVMAAKRGVLINFDMEQHAYKDMTLELFMRACEKWNFPAGIAMQAYLRSAPQDIERIIKWTAQTGRQVTVRLVKGAYWDYEVAHAQQQGWRVPVWMNKHETDACFEAMTQQLIRATPRTQSQGGAKLALGSHNVRSVAAGLAMLREAGLPDEALELQMLRGMAEPFKMAAVDKGLRVREYVPISELVPGMAYLVRRLLENTSNQSWLLGASQDDADDAALLAPPEVSPEVPPALPPEGLAGDDASSMELQLLSPSLHQLSDAPPEVADGQAFMNEPVHDFSDAKVRDDFARAIHEVALPDVPADASEADAIAAADRAHRAFDAWASTPVTQRSELLLRVASLMRQQRDELAGIAIRESGKPWQSADADVCEAIDFLAYYARQAVALMHGRSVGRFMGERNHALHRPRGVTAVISPWNFPLAICCGMTAAALVTGNTVIVKPAEQSPAMAMRMGALFHEAGIGRDVLQILPGRGEVVGAALARDARVANIAFTGSREVGLKLQQMAATVAPGQSFVKRLVCEMGGKNAIIVDKSADPDMAVVAVRDSAFGYAGQKCSACSRVILVGSYEDEHVQRFIHRLIEATRTLVVGDPLDPRTDIGPVIDDDAAASITRYIDVGQTEGRLVYAGNVPPGLEAATGRRFIAPHIFTGIEAHHRLAQEEIFGPVLSVMTAENFQQAVQLANMSVYRLTGAVISRTPSHLLYAQAKFAVGNLYLNRGCTGALVARQPFGGFGLSGTGAKAGGPDYLKQFVDPVHITENTMRSGFSQDVFAMFE